MSSPERQVQSEIQVVQSLSSTMTSASICPHPVVLSTSEPITMGSATAAINVYPSSSPSCLYSPPSSSGRPMVNNSNIISDNTSQSPSSLHPLYTAPVILTGAILTSTAASTGFSLNLSAVVKNEPTSTGQDIAQSVPILPSQQVGKDSPSDPSSMMDTRVLTCDSNSVSLIVEEHQTVQDTKIIDSSKTSEFLVEPVSGEVTKSKTATISSTTTKESLPSNSSHISLLSSTIVDMDIVQLVSNILTLLQIYGPMNEDQLLFNLPTLSNSTITTYAYDKRKKVATPNVIETPTTDLRQQQSLYILKDILDILLALNIIHLMENKTLPPKSNHSLPDLSNVPVSLLSSVSMSHIDAPPPKPKYFFHDGLCRNQHDIIQPNQLFKRIEDANLEIDRSMERISLLHDYLKDKRFDEHCHDTIDRNYVSGGSRMDELQKKNEDAAPNSTKVEDVGLESDLISLHSLETDHGKEDTATSPWIRQSSNDEKPGRMKDMLSYSLKDSEAYPTKSPRELLKHILHQYPETAHDSIYFAAFKNFSIDVVTNNTDRDRGKNASSRVFVGNSHDGKNKNQVSSAPKPGRGRKRKYPITVTGDPNGNDTNEPRKKYKKAGLKSGESNQQRIGPTVDRKPRRSSKEETGTQSTVAVVELKVPMLDAALNPSVALENGHTIKIIDSMNEGECTATNSCSDLCDKDNLSNLF